MIQMVTGPKIPSRVVRWFAISSGVILAVTGVAKLVSTFGAAGILAHDDPILGMSFRHLMLIAGAAECVIASVCFVPRFSTVAVVLTGYLGSLLLLYRMGLVWMDWSRPCPCLGNLTDALHISPAAADTAVKCMLAYLLVGSYSLMFWMWQQRRSGQMRSGPRASAVG